MGFNSHRGIMSTGRRKRFVKLRSATTNPSRNRTGHPKQGVFATYQAPLEIVKELYAKSICRRSRGALALMSDDIAWITMMDYKVTGSWPVLVLEGMLIPAMEEWEPYTLTDA